MQNTPIYHSAEWLTEHYVNQGRTIQELATLGGCSPMAIHQWMRKMGVPTRPAGLGRGYKAGLAYRSIEWLTEHYVNQRLSMTQVAQVAGATPEAIHYWIGKLGIPTRSRGEALSKKVEVICFDCGQIRMIKRSRRIPKRCRTCDRQFRKRDLPASGPPRTCRPTVKDIYWAAGVYEGEGNAWAGGRNTRITVVQKDLWVLERLKVLFGGTIHTRPNGIRDWYLLGSRARGFAMTIYALLSPRRQEQIRHMLNGTSMEATAQRRAALIEARSRA